MARGVKMGRKPKLRPHQRREAKVPTTRGGAGDGPLLQRSREHDFAAHSAGSGIQSRNAGPTNLRN
jgi:hypothetical protein